MSNMKEIYKKIKYRWNKIVSYYPPIFDVKQNKYANARSPIYLHNLILSYKKAV